MQHLFGSEIPSLAQHFRDEIAKKYHVELVIQETQDAQGNVVYDVFLPQNSPHFDAIIAESESFLQAWLAQQNARAWQQSSDNTHVHAASLPSSHLNKASIFSYLQQQKITVIITALCVVIYLCFSVLPNPFCWQRISPKRRRKKVKFGVISRTP